MPRTRRVKRGTFIWQPRCKIILQERLNTESEDKRATTAAELEALLPGMKLDHDPTHTGRLSVPPPMHPGETDWVDEDEDDDYDSLLYSTEDGGEFDDDDSSVDSDPEIEAEKQRMKAKINAEIDAERTPEDTELDLKMERVAELRRAGRAAIKEWKPLPSA